MVQFGNPDTDLMWTSSFLLKEVVWARAGWKEKGELPKEKITNARTKIPSFLILEKQKLKRVHFREKSAGLGHTGIGYACISSLRRMEWEETTMLPAFNIHVAARRFLRVILTQEPIVGSWTKWPGLAEGLRSGDGGTTCHPALGSTVL